MLPAADGSGGDFLDSRLWAQMLRTCSVQLEACGYAPVWLPLAEETALFSRGLGDSSDVVQKEMYTFTDRGNRSLTLRPEGTAGAARAFVEHRVGQRATGVHRWYYAGPMFRAERPQKGRYRQFYQLGAECFGAPAGLADVDMLCMLQQLCAAWGLRDVQIELNSLGDAASRAAYRDALHAFARPRRAQMCANCQARLEHNVLRLLDCKNAACRAQLAEAPEIGASWTPPAADEFARVQALLQQMEVPFVHRPRLVRGLDYYTGLIFEFVEAPQRGDEVGLGAQSTILGGGRYDRLVEELGGPSTPAVGFSAGLERIALLLCAQQQQQQQQQAQAASCDLLLVPLDVPCQLQALRLAQQLRAVGCKVEVDVMGVNANLKALLRRADRLGHRFALVLGSEEQKSGRGQLKNLRQRRSDEIVLRPEALATALEAP